MATDLLSQFRQPVLVETFLPGREFTVAILGTGDDARSAWRQRNRAEGKLGRRRLRLREQGVLAGQGGDHRARIRSSAKAAGRCALAAWRALRCRDGGRVDIRNDADGQPNFIEVNPVAGLRPEYSDMCFIATREGLTYRDLIGRIMASFLKRHPELSARCALPLEELCAFWCCIRTIAPGRACR